MKELHFLFSKPSNTFTWALNSEFFPKRMFSCLLWSWSCLLWRVFPRNPTGSFIILDQLSPLWLKGSPRPTAWSQSSSTWCPRPSSMLVPKPSLVWAPRILYFLLGSQWWPPPIQPHARPCTDLSFSVLSVVSSAWRLLCHLPLEQANTRSLRAGPQPLPGIPTHNGLCSSRYTDCVPGTSYLLSSSWYSVRSLCSSSFHPEQKPGRKVQVTRTRSFFFVSTPDSEGQPYVPFTATRSWSPWNLAFHLLPHLRTHSRRAFIGEPSHSAAVNGTDSGIRESWIQVFFLLFPAHVSGCFPVPLSLGFLLCKMRIKIVHLPYQFILRHNIKCGSYLVLILNTCHFLSRPTEQCQHTVSIQKMFSLQIYKVDSTVSPTSQMRELGTLHLRIWTGSQTCTSLLGSHDIITYLSIP